MQPLVLDSLIPTKPNRSQNTVYKIVQITGKSYLVDSVPSQTQPKYDNLSNFLLSSSVIFNHMGYFLQHSRVFNTDALSN